MESGTTRHFNLTPRLKNQTTKRCNSLSCHSNISNTSITITVPQLLLQFKALHRPPLKTIQSSAPTTPIQPSMSSMKMAERLFNIQIQINRASTRTSRTPTPTWVSLKSTGEPSGSTISRKICQCGVFQESHNILERNSPNRNSREFYQSQLQQQPPSQPHQLPPQPQSPRLRHLLPRHRSTP